MLAEGIWGLIISTPVGRVRAVVEMRGENGAISGSAYGTVLHRICTGYAVLGAAVPVLGFATAASLHVLGSPWLVASILLTAAAAFVLAAMILPAQQQVIAAHAPVSDQVGVARADPEVPERELAARLAAYTGTFNLLWATVTVLMVLLPGSTTGA